MIPYLNNFARKIITFSNKNLENKNLELRNKIKNLEKQIQEYVTWNSNNSDNINNSNNNQNKQTTIEYYKLPPNVMRIMSGMVPFG